MAVQLQKQAVGEQALPSTTGTEDLVPVSSKLEGQKSSPCLFLGEFREVFLPLSQRNRRGMEMLERN